MLTRNAAGGRLRGRAAWRSMHPVLFEVPWPFKTLALWPLYAFVVAAASATAYVGLLTARRSTMTAAIAVALAAAGAWLSLPHARLAIGPLVVRSWGVALALALATGLVLWRRTARRAGLDRDALLHVAAAVFLGGVVGARLLWALLHPRDVGSLGSVLAFYDGGLSGWGALAGGVLGAQWVARRRCLSLPALLDAAAPALGLGVSVTRIGCWLEGCDFGVPLASGAPRFLERLGSFPKDSPAWVAHVLEQGLSPSSERSLPVHPVQLYEAVGAVAVTALAFRMRRSSQAPGLAIGAALASYLVLRVSLDWLRADRREMAMTIALFTAVLLGAAALSLRRALTAKK